MKDQGSHNLVVLFVAVWSGLLAFYGFLAVRARLWSPLWAALPTTRNFSIPIGNLAHLDPQEEKGRILFQEYHCVVCHGPGGRGGVKNPNADPNGMIPNLLDLKSAFAWEDLKNKIRNGSKPYKIDENKPEPPLRMPAWKGVLPEGDLDSIAHYLYSLIDGGHEAKS